MKETPQGIPPKALAQPTKPYINGYVKEVEQECQDCGGSGCDSSSLDPFGDICKSCMGSGKETVIRNYLAEALRIAGNPGCLVPVERTHLVAIVQYCPGS
jgi:hypothetical protein